MKNLSIKSGIVKLLEEKKIENSLQDTSVGRWCHCSQSRVRADLALILVGSQPLLAPFSRDPSHSFGFLGHLNAQSAHADVRPTYRHIRYKIIKSFLKGLGTHEAF